jgi:hypothetical protein
MFQVEPPSVERYHPDISEPTKRRFGFKGDMEGAYWAPPPPMPVTDHAEKQGEDIRKKIKARNNVAGPRPMSLIIVIVYQQNMKTSSFMALNCKGKTVAVSSIRIVRYQVKARPFLNILLDLKVIWSKVKDENSRLVLILLIPVERIKSNFGGNNEK